MGEIWGWLLLVVLVACVVIRLLIRDQESKKSSDSLESVDEIIYENIEYKKRSSINPILLHSKLLTLKDQILSYQIPMDSMDTLEKTISKSIPYDLSYGILAGVWDSIYDEPPGTPFLYPDLLDRVRLCDLINLTIHAKLDAEIYSWSVEILNTLIQQTITAETLQQLCFVWWTNNSASGDGFQDERDHYELRYWFMENLNQRIQRANTPEQLRELCFARIGHREETLHVLKQLRFEVYGHPILQEIWRLKV